MKKQMNYLQYIQTDNDTELNHLIYTGTKMATDKVDVQNNYSQTNKYAKIG